MGVWSKMTEILMTSCVVTGRDKDKRALERFLDSLAQKRAWSSKIAFGLQVVADEWLSNLVKYAFGPGDDWRVDVEVREDPNCVRVDIRDSSDNCLDEVNLRLQTAKMSPICALTGGRVGLMVLGHCADQVVYSRKGDQNVAEFVLYKHCKQIKS